jgi:hypothetical protein
VFQFDVNAFLAAYDQQVLPVRPAASAGFTSLLEALAEDPAVSDVRWAAYMLATVKHECANTWLPIEEYGKGAGRPYGVPVQVTAPDGTVYTNTYYGRGYVQLTWRLNYDRMGNAIGLSNGLVLHPEHALEPGTAYRLISHGMRNGSFTGKKLQDYIHDDVCDYVSARRIINGLDRADLIAGYARQLETLLRASLLPAAASMESGTTTTASQSVAINPQAAPSQPVVVNPTTEPSQAPAVAPIVKSPPQLAPSAIATSSPQAAPAPAS